MRKWWLYFLMIFVLGVGSFAFVKYQKTDKIVKEEQGVLQSVGEAYELIRKESVHETTEKQLIEGAINGMAGALKDPYSTYYTEEEAKMHREQLSDERVGIGAEITESQGRFIIVSPVKDSPAEKAGLKPYDEIVQVNGERTDGKTLTELLALIRGEEGTSLKMTVYRPSEDRHVELNMTRAAITQTTVNSKVLVSEGKNIGYISIKVFGEKTAEEWYKNTNELLKQKITALIVDVRSNPGGYLKSVEQVIGSLVQPNTTYAYMENATGNQEPLQVTNNRMGFKYDEQLKTLPVVLLQDEGSASASEVLSAALKDLRRASIIGVKSFGKGTVQETWPLSNGGELKLSTHKWLTPKREWIHGKGIKATLEVEQNPLFHMKLPPITGNFKEGDFSDNIQSVQEVLKAQGYSVSRVDGYFDRTTAKAIEEYSKKHQLTNGNKMDDTFLFALHEEMVKYRNNLDNDLQLQMAIGFINHQLK
ncbi:S41 family peptidase [Rummeliibacillus pycnus]|uniref:S41 family peptidase n=1 Tax=Rummeliibacillus pycnus TaxID=101070 RepID=UPI000C9A42FA|nr:S41 family peptidase [Rummeliibacillus pycnus]